MKPDIIIETGIAHGGSLILSASMMVLLELEECLKGNLRQFFISNTKRKVVGVDIEIRDHNKKAIKDHFLSFLIEIIEGSSTDPNVIKKVRDICSNYKKAMVFLDSNHTSEHVFNELIAYAPCVGVGSYCVVWDTGIEELPADFYRNRPWGRGNNPMTAVHKFMRWMKEDRVTDKNGIAVRYKIDKSIHQKLAITAAPFGFLKRIR